MIKQFELYLCYMYNINMIGFCYDPNKAKSNLDKIKHKQEDYQKLEPENKTLLIKNYCFPFKPYDCAITMGYLIVTNSSDPVG